MTLTASLPNLANTTQMIPRALGPIPLHRFSFDGRNNASAKNASVKSEKSSPCLSMFATAFRFVPDDFHKQNVYTNCLFSSKQIVDTICYRLPSIEPGRDAPTYESGGRSSNLLGRAHFRRIYDFLRSANAGPRRQKFVVARKVVFDGIRRSYRD